MEKNCVLQDIKPLAIIVLKQHVCLTEMILQVFLMIWEKVGQHLKVYKGRWIDLNPFKSPAHFPCALHVASERCMLLPNTKG